MSGTYVGPTPRPRDMHRRRAGCQWMPHVSQVAQIQQAREGALFIYDVICVYVPYSSPLLC